MRKSSKRIFFTVLILVALMIVSCGIGLAASATLSVSGGTVNKGSSITVTVKYSGAKYGTAAADISYDKSYLQFESCSATYGGGSGKLTVSMVDVNKSSLSCTVKFKALKAGSTTVTVTPVEAYDMEGVELTASSKSAKVTIKDPSTAASGNANLSTLKVSAGSLSPSFSADKTSYSVNVPNDVTSCTLSVKTADAKATYKISGASNLQVGQNIRTVTVTAENGKTKTYTITIIRAESESTDTGNEDNPPVEETDEPKEEESETDDNKQLETTIGDKTYIICENVDNKDIPQGFAMTVAKYGDKEIPVFKDNKLKYTVALLKDKELGDEGWFFFDEEKDTFKAKTSLTADEIIAYEEIVSKYDFDSTHQTGLKSTDKVLFIALGSTTILLFGAILVMQYNIIKTKKKR